MISDTYSVNAPQDVPLGACAAARRPENQQDNQINKGSLGCASKDVDDRTIANKSERLAWMESALVNLPNIYLVGPMGAGKTTIGKLLAKQLDRQFVDCDWYICQQTGADIPWIFEIEGETGFRERETKALSELVATSPIVMATGGGAVEREKNRAMLKNGIVIYLNAPVEVQLLRTKKDKNRPLLQQANPKQVLEALYKKRHPLYLEVADIVMESGRAYPKQMLADVLSALLEYAKSQQKIIHADSIYDLADQH